MSDKEWHNEIEENYKIEAAILEADGWQRVGPHFDDNSRPVFSYWIKDGKTATLRRQLGSSNWYKVEVTKCQP